MDLNFEYLRIYFDGGSRGNPGPSAVGAAIYDKNSNLIDELSECIGEFTNNQAEYLALEKVLDLIKKYKIKYNIRKIILSTDSKLVYSQLKGIWKIKNIDILEIFKRVVKKLKDYEVVDLRLIPREDNKMADKLVNQALDKKDRLFNADSEINFGNVDE
jgi:ribonuclease HI